MHRKTIAACALLATVLAGCSEATPPAPPSPIATAQGVLTGAYASDVKPADASNTQCKFADVDGRHVARCGISYGGAETAQNGYWEITAQGDKYALYAMNGKALSALDKINAPGSLTSKAYPGVFHGGQGREPLDTAKINQAIQ